jgi:hypothetical protein
VQFVFGDGHVAMLSDSTDQAVYRGLSTRAKGEIVTLP